MKTSPIALIALVAAAAFVQDATAFGCKPDDIKKWIKSCDVVSGGSQKKCDDKECHKALHRLVEEETIQCYVSSGLGPASDLAKWKALDDFCHGDGPDPVLTPTLAPPQPTTSAPVPTVTPGPNPNPTPSTPSTTAPTPTATGTKPSPTSPNTTTPVPSTTSPRPQC
ncbi:hypothetical protein P43SY_010101 [Pythium insidiosum]|uniref:Elicitin-like protein n=1 Tax=Pythium insidiosum TaxID=114742 RepID=A0AAD5LQB4_PYTIN|nr:hypothetical protein P43SY_010101 [Pythium insidiosum]KAJ0411046.1 hypothetical protein ATCC90586_003648 [Pythium insidiosum]